MCSIIEGQWEWYSYRGFSRSNKTVTMLHPETDYKTKTAGEKDRTKI